MYMYMHVCMHVHKPVVLTYITYNTGNTITTHIGEVVAEGDVPGDISLDSCECYM